MPGVSFQSDLKGYSALMSRNPFSLSVTKCGHCGGLWAGGLLTCQRLNAPGLRTLDTWWAQAGRKEHSSQPGREAWFPPLGSSGPPPPEEASFETQKSLDICLNLPFRRNATEGASLCSLSSGFPEEGSWGWGANQGKREGDRPSWVQSERCIHHPKWYKSAITGIMQKQLCYLSPLLCFLNLFSAQPNELSELSDSSKEWQMSMLCSGGCYFARNTWCM